MFALGGGEGEAAGLLAAGGGGGRESPGGGAGDALREVGCDVNTGASFEGETEVSATVGTVTAPPGSFRAFGLLDSSGFESTRKQTDHAIQCNAVGTQRRYMCELISALDLMAHLESLYKHTLWRSDYRILSWLLLL